MTSTYEEKDELPHEPDGDPWWQESVVVTWWDDTAGLGGLVRLGNEAGQGTSTVWLGAVTADGRRYRYCDGALPSIDPERTSDGFVVRDDAGVAASCLLEDGRLHWEMGRPGFEADLVLDDFYPMTNVWALGKKGSLAAEFAPQHWEASGRLTGTMRLGGTAHEIDALYHRDHSWGIRRWNSLRTHRWVAGTTGPELSFMGLSWLAADGTLVAEGFVNRNGVTTLTEKIDIVSYIETDGISCRGGVIRFDLPDGESITVEATAVDGICSTHRDVACVDALSRIRTSTGRTGFCDFETTHNTRGGTEPVVVTSGSALADGLSQRP